MRLVEQHGDAVKRVASLPPTPHRVPVWLTERQLLAIKASLKVTGEIMDVLENDAAAAMELHAYVVGQLACHFPGEGGDAA